MGFLSEIKKLLFAKKSVAKSAMDKSSDFIKDKADDFSESAQEFAQETGSTLKEKTSGLRDAVMDTTGDLIEKGKDAWEDISEKVGESEVVKKAADVTENIGDKVLDAGEKTMDFAKDISEGLGEKIMDVKDDLVEKAKDLTGDMSEKLDETIKKAEKMAEEEAALPKKDFADDTLDTGESLLSGEDDFFAKAAKYAEGDYDSMLEGKTTIIESTDPVKKRPPAKAAGFEDIDGDGNELIDDAIISEEE